MSIKSKNWKSPFTSCLLSFTPGPLLSQITIINSLGFIFPNCILHLCLHMYKYAFIYPTIHKCVFTMVFFFAYGIILYLFLCFFLYIKTLASIVRKDKHNIHVSFLVFFSCLVFVSSLSHPLKMNLKTLLIFPVFWNSLKCLSYKHLLEITWQPWGKAEIWDNLSNFFPVFIVLSSFSPYFLLHFGKGILHTHFFQP